MPEECSVPVFRNIPKSGNFTRNNCGGGFTPGSVTYTVPANTYSSTISQPYVDSVAQADVNANGQTYANTNATCTPNTIYAKTHYTDWYYDVTQVYATVLIKFYSDEACTTPVSVSNLTVNYIKYTYPCSGGSSSSSYNVSGSGTQISLGSQRLVWDDGETHCFEYGFQTTTGTGYVPIQQ